jgi:glycosyltransferase involved in cell wall biosynthesis
VLIVTDAFPPRCGGSGWSTFQLARALAERGHAVRVVKPEPNRPGVQRREHEGIPVVDFGYTLLRIPYVRSWLRDETLRRRLERFLVAELESWPADVVHAQHVVSAPPAISAAARLGKPAVVTVRDYWPVCYFTTAHVEGARCPDCAFAEMLACLRGKSPRAYWMGIPLMPYMRRNVRRKQVSLAEANAVIAVSRFIAERAVRPVVDAEKTYVIANSIDVEEVGRVTANPPGVELPKQFILFVGKLNRLKGAWLALDAAARVDEGVPLVMVGDGVDRGPLEASARERRLAVQFLPWVENHEVLRIMSRASAVLVPSLWHEPLARTVTEAMAVGTPILATDRGGIHDQIGHHQSGAILSPDADVFAAEIRRVLADPTIGRSWAKRAREAVASRFDNRVVIPRIEALYSGLVGSRIAPPVSMQNG